MTTIARVRELRGLPFLKRGMRVEVNGKMGTITSANSSLNLNVRMDAGYRDNVHPRWMTRYFDKDGQVIADYATPPDNGKADEMSDEEKYLEDKDTYRREELESRFAAMNGQVQFSDDGLHAKGRTNFCSYWFTATEPGVFSKDMHYYH